tara:strand:+ start:259 stop:636 length:378 start_codon:yes stop_codon:yes gene_type:complete
MDTYRIEKIENPGTKFTWCVRTEKQVKLGRNGYLCETEKEAETVLASIDKIEVDDKELKIFDIRTTTTYSKRYFIKAHSKESAEALIVSEEYNIDDCKVQNMLDTQIDSVTESDEDYVWWKHNDK